MSGQFAVGLKVERNSERIVVDAEDALIAALKVKAERPEAVIMYVRRSNRRGDTRRTTCGPICRIRPTLCRRWIRTSLHASAAAAVNSQL